MFVDWLWTGVWEQRQGAVEGWLGARLTVRAVFIKGVLESSVPHVLAQLFAARVDVGHFLARRLLSIRLRPGSAKHGNTQQP